VGAAEVLVKPIELTEIHRVLRNYLGNGAATAAPDPVPLSKEIRTSRPV
jgi:hypothetical protein